MNPLDPTRNQGNGQIDEALLAAAAFGTLDRDEERALQDLLAHSPEARAELASLQELAGNFALLADERAPSSGLRDRIEAAIAGGDATAASPAPLGPAPLRATPAPTRIPSGWWLAAAAAIVVALVGGVLLDRFVLGDEASGPDTIASQLTTPMPDVSAELTYDEDSQLFMLTMENMPAAPEGQVYQVWLIDHENVPHPMGTMPFDTFAVTADRDNYQVFAITLEPAPIGSAAPSTAPILVAPLTPTPEDS
jgi:anti-sigma-K factor RskA